MTARSSTARKTRYSVRVMRRLSLPNVRAIGSSLFAIAGASIVVVACSDRVLLPSATDNQRIYTCADLRPPVRLGGDTFADLYRDVFSLAGVAKCQTSSCHGNTTGPGGNGMAMYPSEVAPPGDGAPPPTKGEIGLSDDRGLYCGLTSHLRSYTSRAAPCRDAAGLDCECRPGDKCKCGAGPNKGQECCNPKAAGDATCDGSATKCDEICRRLVVTPHVDGSDSTPDSDLLTVLSPSKDGEPAFMPNSLGWITRKLLPEELARIASWLKRGAPYDGSNTQPAYDCPPPVQPSP